MTRLFWLAILTFTLVGGGGNVALLASDRAVPDKASDNVPSDDAANEDAASDDATRAEVDEQPLAAEEPAPLEFFAAMNKGQVDVKFIARSDHAARMIITNKTKQPITLKMPEAFAGVPVAAQFGGGGGGGRGGGGGGFGGGGGGGGQQSVGGGGGGGMMGGGGMGGGMFSVPPEQTKKINFPVVCLDHGLRDPSSSKPYKIVPADQHVANPAVVELLKAFGHGQLEHGAAQAAAWNLNSGVSWNELAAKRQGTRRVPSRQPYFTAREIQAGMAYANRSAQLAAENAEEYRDFGKAKDADRYEEARYSDEDVEDVGEKEAAEAATSASPEDVSARD